MQARRVAEYFAHVGGVAPVQAYRRFSAVRRLVKEVLNCQSLLTLGIRTSLRNVLRSLEVFAVRAHNNDKREILLGLLPAENPFVLPLFHIRGRKRRWINAGYLRMRLKPFICDFRRPCKIDLLRRTAQQAHEHQPTEANGGMSERSRHVVSSIMGYAARAHASRVLDFLRSSYRTASQATGYQSGSTPHPGWS